MKRTYPKRVNPRPVLTRFEEIKLQKRHEVRKPSTPIHADVFEIKVIKRPIVALMESDQDRHHFARMQTPRMPPGFTGEA